MEFTEFQNGTLSLIFHLKSKHVILPTDVYPLFILVYHGIAIPGIYLTGLVGNQMQVF